MTVRVAGEVILLEGVCGSDEAEPLLRHLQMLPTATIDWRGCDLAHTAVLQIMLAARRPIKGPPRGHELRKWAAPLLAASDT